MEYIAFSIYAFLNYISMHNMIFKTNGISFSWCVSATFQKPCGEKSLITKKSTCCLQPRSEKLLSGRRHLWNDLPGNREEQRDTHTSCDVLFSWRRCPAAAKVESRPTLFQDFFTPSAPTPPPLRPVEIREWWIRLGLLILGRVEMLSRVSHRVVLCLRVDSCREG